MVKAQMDEARERAPGAARGTPGEQPVNREPARQDPWSASFRANPNYQLVLFDRLPPDQQRMLAELRRDPDLYGILRPREEHRLGVKSVCRDTALLYLTLREPGPLPAYLREIFGAEYRQAVTQMVLDRVLEIEHRDGFVCGSDALSMFARENPSAGHRTRLGWISAEALRYAQYLDIDEATKLSARIYFFNRIPVTPVWRQRYRHTEAVLEELAAQPGGANRAILDRSWSRVPLAAPKDGWFLWKSRHVRWSRREDETVYKLYLSPLCDGLRDAFSVCLEVLTDCGVPRFKVGNSASGLLRPDKIVVYLRSEAQLHEVGQRLTEALDGIPAHGVPFTAPLTDDGLLSWGLDPPLTERTFSWQERESWRLWLTNRLATYLLAAREASTSSTEPWQFALERIQLEGVDPETWTPDPAVWMANDAPAKE